MYLSTIFILMKSLSFDEEMVRFESSLLEKNRLRTTNMSQKITITQFLSKITVYSIRY